MSGEIDRPDRSSPYDPLGLRRSEVALMKLLESDRIKRCGYWLLADVVEAYANAGWMMLTGRYLLHDPAVDESSQNIPTSGSCQTSRGTHDRHSNDGS